MSRNISDKNILFIISFVLLFDISFVFSTEGDCVQWEKYCLFAKNSKNPKFQCKKTAIYYYNDDQTLSWDEARQQCSQKFDATINADLVQFPEDQYQHDVSAILSELRLGGIELATSGVCCMRMTGENQVASPCTWIMKNEKIDIESVQTTGDECQVVLYKFDGKDIKYFTTTGVTSSEIKPFLCAYINVDNCHFEGPPDPTPPQTPPPDHVTTKPVSTSTPLLTTPSDSTHEEIDEHLDEIHNKLKDPELNTSQLLDYSHNLKDLFNVKYLATNNTLKKTLDIIGNMSDLFHQMSRNTTVDHVTSFTDNIVETTSSLLSGDEVWDAIDHDETVTLHGSRILALMQDVSYHMGCKKDQDTGTNIKITKDNIVIKTFTLDYNKSTLFLEEDRGSAITVPAGIHVPEFDDSCTYGTAVGAMFDKLSRYLKVTIDDNHRINSNIVAFSADNSLNTTLLPDNIDPVRIVVKHNQLLKFGDRIQCVYWDFNDMKWSSKGCEFHQINSNRRQSICECNHMTNFAALMDVSGRETNTKLKDILTKVVSGLSIVCLIVTIGFLTLCRVLRNRRSNITCNLCVCLLAVNLLVVFGMDGTGNNVLCQIVSALLLYFLLGSFSWMLMEGYHLYQMIVLVFSNIGHLRLIYLYAIGYGAPFIITVSALLGIGFSNARESDSYFCWISSPSHPYRVWAVAGPALIAILANGLIMYLALREAFSAKLKKKQISEKDFSSTNTNNTITNLMTISEKVSKSLSWMKGFVSLVVLLGLTWVTFLLYIHEFGQWFSYIFITLNGLQGVFIFTFQILLNDKARAVLRKSYRRRHPSRFLSSLYKTNSTNVFTSIRSKSVSKDKNTSDNSISSPNSGLNSETNSADSGHESVGSHRSQSIFINRIRNASETIFY